MQDNNTKLIHSTAVDVVELTIKANNIDEIINAIRQKLENYPHLHLFHGHFFCLVKAKPTVSFESAQEFAIHDSQ